MIHDQDIEVSKIKRIEMDTLSNNDLLGDQSDDSNQQKRNINYRSISKEKPLNLSIKSSALNELDWKKFKVMSKLAKRSIASNAQSVLTSYVRKFWGEYENSLIYEADQIGITPEELFNQLANNND